MKRVQLVVAACCGLTACVLAIVTIGAQVESRTDSSEAQRLIGTWRLMSFESSDQEMRRARGDQPVGLLFYDRMGYMAAQIMPDRNRRPFTGAASGVFAGPSPNIDEALDAITGYTAYFGTYSLDERSRTVTHLSMLVLLVGVCFGSAWLGAQQPVASAEVERRIVGTWELAEWHFEGQVLRPPVVNGRWQAHDGQAVSIYDRDTGGTRWDVYSYGTYSTSQGGWSYGWERRLEITRKAGEATVLQTMTPQTLFTPRIDGTDLVLDSKGGERRFVFGANEFVYIERGQVLRKWRRVRGGA